MVEVYSNGGDSIVDLICYEEFYDIDDETENNLKLGKEKKHIRRFVDIYCIIFFSVFFQRISLDNIDVSGNINIDTDEGRRDVDKRRVERDANEDNSPSVISPSTWRLDVCDCFVDDVK